MKAKQSLSVCRRTKREMQDMSYSNKIDESISDTARSMMGSWFIGVRGRVVVEKEEKIGRIRKEDGNRGGREREKKERRGG